MSWVGWCKWINVYRQKTLNLEITLHIHTFMNVYSFMRVHQINVCIYIYAYVYITQHIGYQKSEAYKHHAFALFLTSCNIGKQIVDLRFVVWCHIYSVIYMYVYMYTNTFMNIHCFLTSCNKTNCIPQIRCLMSYPFSDIHVCIYVYKHIYEHTLFSNAWTYIVF